jgi:hypothetical protein
LTDTGHCDLQYSCDLLYCISTIPSLNEMKLPNLLFILPAIQAGNYLFSIYAPDYAKDTMQVEGKYPNSNQTKVWTHANSLYASSDCISTKLKTGSTCDLTPIFHTVASFLVPSSETKAITVRMPTYDLEVSPVLNARLY